MKNFISRWWPTAIVVAVILYSTLASDPTPDMDMSLFPHFDKLIHAVMFGGLAGALAFDWRRAHRDERLSGGRMLAFCIAATLFGAAVELAQDAMHNGRSADWLDLAADAAGAAVAFFTAPKATAAVLKKKNR